MNYDYQGHQNWNQGNYGSIASNIAVTVDEKSKTRSNRQRSQFKGYSYKDKQQTHGTHMLDSNHSEQAGMLTEQLLNESYECMVCCDKIRCHVAVWCCDNCYHVFHLKCARKWARSPMAVIEGTVYF
jgi:transcriptional repressor NF-X1